MSDNTIQFEDIVEFWMTFFPEINSRSDFEELLEKYSGSLLHDLEKQCNADSDINPDKMFIVLNSEEYICSPLQEIFTEAEKTQKWVYFFRPLIAYYSLELYSYIEGIELVQDKRSFFSEIISYILNALFSLAYKVLVLEINVARMDGKLEGETSIEKAQYFSNVLLKDTAYLKGLYREYSELTRLMEIKTKNICNFVIEIIDNTKSQYDQLVSHFCNNDNLGKLVSLTMGEGDSHNNSRTVAKLLFSSGIKLIYKPRDLQIERGYCDFIDWINNQKIKGFKPLQAPKVHYNSNAGWMEFIEHKECSDSEEVKHFYYRTGQLLCLLYVLNAKDFHYENLIAHGGQPVLIDLETLFHPENFNIQQGNSNANTQGAYIISNSVKGIALLPTQIVNQKNNKILEIGGLSNTESQTAPFKSSYLKDYDSADIKIESDYGFIQAKSNNPILAGKAADSQQYLKEIKDGFSYTYYWIKDNKNLFREKIDYYFKGAPGRFLYRPTNVYMQLLSTSYHPDVLRSTLDRKVYLHRVGLVTDIKEKEISASELMQMLDGDVPYFLTYYDGNSILTGNGKAVMSLPGHSANSSIYKKLDTLSDYDLNLQLTIINYSYSSEAEISSSCATKMPFCKPVNNKNVNTGLLLETAKIIGDFILSLSIVGNTDGKKDRTWIGLTEIIKDYSDVTCVGNDIYSGNSGIALFLACLGEITGDLKYKEAAMEAILTVVDTINKSSDFSTGKIGFFSGVSGWLYSIFHVGRMLNNKELIDFVYKKVSIVKQMISLDQNWDVISGAAGAIGAMISIYENTENIEMKKLLVDICNDLYGMIKQKIIVLEDNRRITWGEEGFVGFSHGNAGVISQIIRLYNITGEADIINTVKSSLCYENSMYDKQKGNWCKQLNSDIFYYKWCHGAPGILLSRLILYKNGIINEEIENEIYLTIEKVKQNGFGDSYCLCHGDLGNLLILNYASQIMKDEGLRNDCLLTAENFVNNYFQKSWNGGGLKQTENAGLMTGLSGLGYGLLQLYKPEITPDILRIE